MSEDQIRFFRTIIEPVDDLMAYIRSGHRVNKIFFSTTDTLSLIHISEPTRL